MIDIWQIDGHLNLILKAKPFLQDNATKVYIVEAS